MHQAKSTTQKFCNNFYGIGSIFPRGLVEPFIMNIENNLKKGLIK